MTSIYKGRGRTPYEAFQNLWPLIGVTDDYCLRKEEDGWCLRLEVVVPTQKKTEEFEENG